MTGFVDIATIFGLAIWKIDNLGDNEEDEVIKPENIGSQVIHIDIDKEFIEVMKQATAETVRDMQISTGVNTPERGDEEMAWILGYNEACRRIASTLENADLLEEE